MKSYTVDEILPASSTTYRTTYLVVATDMEYVSVMVEDVTRIAWYKRCETFGPRPFALEVQYQTDRGIDGAICYYNDENACVLAFKAAVEFMAKMRP